MQEIAGANPAVPTNPFRFAPVAQSIERRRPKAEAVGENPAGRTNYQLRGRSSASERLPDMQEAEGAIPSVPTILARVAQTTEHGGSNAGDEGETPSASAIFSGCNVSSRRPRSERGGRRCNSCHPDHFGWLAEQQCPGPENRVRFTPAWVAIPTPSAKSQPLTKGTKMKPIIRYQSQLLYRKSYKPIRIIHIRPDAKAMRYPFSRAGPQSKTYECKVH